MSTSIIEIKSRCSKIKRVARFVSVVLLLFIVSIPVNAAEESHTALFSDLVDRKWGFADTNGIVRIDPQFDGSAEFKGGYAIVEKEDQRGILNLEGEFTAIDNEYETTEFSEGLMLVSLRKETFRSFFTGKIYSFGFMNPEGELEIDLKFDYGGNFSEGLARVNEGATGGTRGAFRGGKWGYADKEGKVVIDYEFEDSGDFHEGLARVKKRGKWGFIDAEGEWIIVPEYSYVFDFSSGLASVLIGDQFGYIDKTGELKIENIYDFAGSYSEKYAVVSRSMEENPVVIDLEGNFVFGGDYELIGPFHDGLARVRRNGKYGFVDTTGELVIEAIYDDIHDFHNGLAWAPLENGSGYINKEGEFVIVYRYQ